MTSFFGIKVWVFLENDKTDLRQIFFHGLGENTFHFYSNDIFIQVTLHKQKLFNMTHLNMT